MLDIGFGRSVRAVPDIRDCSDCLGKVTPFAEGLAALGAVALASLTVDDALVLAAADLFDATPQSALKLLQAVSAVISNGAAAVARALCAAAGYCA